MLTRSLDVMKSLFRDGLNRLGLLDTYIAWRLGPERSIARQANQSLEDVFSQVYARKLWIETSDQESLSGSGSTTLATATLVGRLSEVLADIGCTKLVDIGCGDFNWMRNVRGDFDYLGIDVVPQVIADNIRLHADHRHRFLCMDATREAIEPGDVAFCREVLFHLSYEDGFRLLRNIKAAGFRYVVLTDETAAFNIDITSGGFRKLNLSRKPFRLPHPERELADDAVMPGRRLGIWPCTALPD